MLTTPKKVMSKYISHLLLKRESKAVPALSLKAYRLYIYISGQLQAPAAFVHGENTTNTFWIGRWVGPRAQSGCFGEEEIYLALPGIEPLYTFVQPVPTEIFLPIHVIFVQWSSK